MKTSIEWCDRSTNPIRARDLRNGNTGHYCQKISPGCANCYASRFQPRRHMPVFPGGGVIDPNIEIYLDEKALKEVLARKEPTKWFWCDMSDMFGYWVPSGMQDRCFDVMEKTPQHVHQILTKRPKAMASYVTSRWKGRPLANTNNLWFGVSVENQTMTSRIAELRQCPAGVRFLSIEPLLEHFIPDLTGIDWVIIGGESGPGARPCDINWIREIVVICKMHDVPCFVKQLGSNPITISNGGASKLELIDTKGGDPNEWPEDLRVRQFPKAHQSHALDWLAWDSQRLSRKQEAIYARTPHRQDDGHQQRPF